MKKLNIIGLACELSLVAIAILCLVLSIVNGYVALIIISALMLIGILYIAGSYIADHIDSSFNYFAPVIWFWNVVCKKGFWEIICIKFFWEILHIRVAYQKFDKWKAWLYLSPALVLLLIFTIWPIFNTLRMAFTVYWDPDEPIYLRDEEGYVISDEETGKQTITGYGAYKGYSVAVELGNKTALEQGKTDEVHKFTFGFSNFKRVVGTKGFGTIMKNTMILCIATVPISTFLALLIAVCLNAIKPLRRFLQTIFFMPYVTNSIAIGMVFAAMFNIVGLNAKNIADSQSLGIINTILGVFGIDPQIWVNQGSSYWANITVMIIYIVWNALPFKILILLGGLQSVNKQYYEAAKVDATPRWRVFTRITIPLLSPMIAYVVITGFIGGFKEYSSIVGIFGDGMQPPASIPSATPVLQTMVGYIYECLGNVSLGEGTASAAALILFAIIFVVTLINLYVSKRNTHY